MSQDLPKDECELVKLAASCSDTAFCALVDRFDGLITHIVSRSTNDPDLRQDLHSDIIARLLAKRKKPLRDWRPTAPFGAYLAAIATRLCYGSAAARGEIDGVQSLRLPGSTSHMAPDVLDSVVPSSDTQDPQTALIHNERVEVLERAMGGLSDADRLVLKLRFVDDLSGPLIAEILGISHTAARQRIFRALRRLERELADTARDYFE